MKGPTGWKRQGALLLWGGTLLMAGWMVWGAAKPTRPQPPAVLAMGDLLSLKDVEAAFEVGLGDAGRSWLLLLEPNCPASISTATMMPALRSRAESRGAVLLPLIVAPDVVSAARLEATLRSHGVDEWGLAGLEGFQVLRTFTVPTLIEVDSRGRVTELANPLTLVAPALPVADPPVRDLERALHRTPS